MFRVGGFGGAACALLCPHQAWQALPSPADTAPGSQLQVPRERERERVRLRRLRLQAALPEGWRGQDAADEQARADALAQEARAWASVDAPASAPQHGYGMAEGKRWEGLHAGAQGTARVMLATEAANAAGPQPLQAGIRSWRPTKP